MLDKKSVQVKEFKKLLYEANANLDKIYKNQFTILQQYLHAITRQECV